MEWAMHKHGLAVFVFVFYATVVAERKKEKSVGQYRLCAYFSLSFFVFDATGVAENTKITREIQYRTSVFLVSFVYLTLQQKCER